MADTITATAQQGETLDALVWRILNAGSGVVEQVMELNRGIADAGPILTEGQTVILPNLLTTATPEKAMVNLWD
jgi:phage tail protein X